ncbi:MAG TPA: hypothetical protein VJJ82_05230 [Candidatus Nanoarchaeia archaeon]|nr:hypothetical protein [Candidatus Nanoarchaeia archaeon]
MYQEVIVFLVACFVLYKAGFYAVKSVTHLARALRVTEFVTSFILIAFISSLPEAFISIVAAFEGDPSLGIGTLLGSNIADLTLILGIVGLAGRGLRIHSSIIRKDIYFVALTILPVLLGIDGTLSRIDAIVLLCAGIGFAYVLIKERAYFHEEHHEHDHLLKSVIVLLVSLAALLLSAHAIVWSTHSLAIGLGVSSLLLGLVFTALGTTLPELTFSLQSIKKKHASLALGDILGVVVVDATIMVGLTALIMPITLNLFVFGVVGVFTAFAAVFAVLFMRSGKMLSTEESLTLIFFYVAFVVAQVLLR